MHVHEPVPPARAAHTATSFSVRVSSRRRAAGSGASVPLRTHTVTAPRLRLETYHDNASLRAALSRLQQCCLPHTLDAAEELSKLRGTGAAALNALPGHVLMHCFTFCAPAALGQLGGVCRRFAAIAGADMLWAPLAAARGVSGGRDAWRQALFDRHAKAEAEERRHTEAYNALAQRLDRRVEAERALPPPTQTQTARRGGEEGERHVRAEEEEKWEQLEAEQAALMRTVRDMQSALAQQKARVEEMQRGLANGEALDSAQSTSHSDERPHGEVGEMVWRDVLQFERRVCRVVLNTMNDLSPILRRGVVDFGTLELLCLHAAGDAGDTVRQRWSAFKRFFPLSNDYAEVRAMLLTREAPKGLREKEALDRLGGVIRRVMRMTDEEILKIVM